METIQENPYDLAVIARVNNEGYDERLARWHLEMASEALGTVVGSFMASLVAFPLLLPITIPLFISSLIDEIVHSRKGHAINRAASRPNRVRHIPYVDYGSIPPPNAPPRQWKAGPKPKLPQTSTTYSVNNSQNELKSKSSLLEDLEWQKERAAIVAERPAI